MNLLEHFISWGNRLNEWTSHPVAWAIAIALFVLFMVWLAFGPRESR